MQNEPRAPRPPSDMMKLPRLGSLYPTRLSFMRTLVRRAISDGWVFEPPQMDLDENGYGRAIYRVRTQSAAYALIAFSQFLDPALRNDRVIAEAWDATFVLFDGEPTQDDLDRLAGTVPLQEAARFTNSELVLSRANKSVRMFEHAVSRLASGQQPDIEFLKKTGYLMRTTAVYGNGKFGIADRSKFDCRKDVAAPFQVEFLTVFLIRQFTIDLAEHIARARGGATAVGFDSVIRRYLGIGNSTGLGMAPFLFYHPALLSRWLEARETALARVRGSLYTTPEQFRHFLATLDRAILHFRQWKVEDEAQSAKISTVGRELAQLRDRLKHERSDHLASVWDDICAFAEAQFSMDGQEAVFSLVLEPNSGLIDDLSDAMSLAQAPALDPGMTVERLGHLIDEHYAWALEIDLSRRQSLSKFWYVSEEKKEPRLGNRFDEPGADKEMPFAVATAVQDLVTVLATMPPKTDLGTLFLSRPDLIYVVRRIQTTALHAYAEIRDNLVGEDCLPVNMLRCKLSFFGASKFDPLSDRWLRVTLFQGAPNVADLGDPDADDWLFPVIEDAA